MSHCLCITKHGWPLSSEKEVELFHRRKEELTLQDSGFMWGSPVIIPKYQAQLSGELQKATLAF